MSPDLIAAAQMTRSRNSDIPDSKQAVELLENSLQSAFQRFRAKDS